MSIKHTHNRQDYLKFNVILVDQVLLRNISNHYQIYNLIIRPTNLEFSILIHQLAIKIHTFSNNKCHNWIRVGNRNSSNRAGNLNF